jgi:hypothetical protein
LYIQYDNTSKDQPKSNSYKNYRNDNSYNNYKKNIQSNSYNNSCNSYDNYYKKSSYTKDNFNDKTDDLIHNLNRKVNGEHLRNNKILYPDDNLTPEKRQKNEKKIDKYFEELEQEKKIKKEGLM